MDFYQTARKRTWPELCNGFVSSQPTLIAQLIVACERFEPRSHCKSRLSLIVRVIVVLNRTVVVDSD